MSMLLGSWHDNMDCLLVLSEYTDCGRDSHSLDFRLNFESFLGKLSQDALLGDGASTSSNVLVDRLIVPLSQKTGTFSMDPGMLLLGVSSALWFWIVTTVCVRSGCTDMYSETEDNRFRISTMLNYKLEYWTVPIITIKRLIL